MVSNPLKTLSAVITNTVLVSVPAIVAMATYMGFGTLVFDKPYTINPTTRPTKILGKTDIIGFWKGMFTSMGSRNALIKQSNPHTPPNEAP